MHSGMRRVPAERARHAKRLGHVQSGSGPPNPVVLLGLAGNSTSSQTPPQSTTSTSTTPTSTNQPPSSAPSSSSSTQSPSSAPGSPSSSLTLPTSTSTFSPIPPITLSSSVIDSIASSPTPPTSSTSTPHSPTGATSRGLPGGAIAGIIAGGVIVGIALIVFFVRKTYLRRRENRRISWTKAPGMGGDLTDELKFGPDTIDYSSPSFTVATNAPQRIAPLSPFDFEARGKPAHSTLPPVQLRTMPAYAIPPHPSATYNNPAYPTQPLPYNPGSNALAMTHGASGMRMSSTLPSTGLQRAPVEAIVKCTFVPTLPDELSIITGERVVAVEQYDDGWDLCMNARGERGMVPHECLEHAPSDQPDIGWRNVKRSSSLNIDGKRY